jgi:arylsulfatase A-like enzyme
VITKEPWEIFFEGVEQLSDKFFGSARVQPELESRADYATAIIGNWHLGGLGFRAHAPGVRPQHRRQRRRLVKPSLNPGLHHGQSTPPDPKDQAPPPLAPHASPDGRHASPLLFRA